MNRDFTKETLAQIEAEMYTAEEEFINNLPLSEMFFLEYENMDIGNMPLMIENSYNGLLEKIQRPRKMFYALLEQVHAVEEYYARKMSLIQESMKNYEQSIRSVAQMFQTEKISMEPSAYQAELVRIKEGYNGKSAEIQLLEQGFSIEHLEKLRAYGYSNMELVTLFEDFTKEEIIFFGYLLDGTEESYEKAFAMSPDNFSADLCARLADYPYWLLHAGDYEALDLFNTVMSKSSECGSYVYLLNLGTRSMLEQEVERLAAMTGEEATYVQELADYEEKMLLMSLWGTEYALISQIIQSEQKLVSMSNLTVQDGEISFELERLNVCENNSWIDDAFETIGRVYWKQEVTVGICDSNGDMQDVLSGERIEIAREAVEMADRERTSAALNLVWEIAELIPGVKGIEALQVAMGFIAAVGRKSLSEIDFSSLTQDEFLADNLEMMGDLLDAAHDVTEANEELAQAKAWLKQTREWEWMSAFGTGGYYEIDGDRTISFYGVLDPEIYRNLERVSEKGIFECFVAKESEGAVKIENTYNPRGNSVERILYAMYNRQFDFVTLTYVDINGNLITPSYDDFLVAIRSLDVNTTELKTGRRIEEYE